MSRTSFPCPEASHLVGTARVLEDAEAAGARCHGNDCSLRVHVQAGQSTLAGLSGQPKTWNEHSGASGYRWNSILRITSRSPHSLCYSEFVYFIWLYGPLFYNYPFIITSKVALKTQTLINRSINVLGGTAIHSNYQKTRKDEIVKSILISYIDDTGEETMGNKGGTTLHSFLHRRIWA